MESLIKVDIFFFISSVATIILTALVSVLLFYLIKASKNLYTIAQALKDGFKESEEFVLDLKERLEDNMIFRLFFPLARKRRRHARKNSSAKKGQQ